MRAFQLAGLDHQGCSVSNGICRASRWKQTEATEHCGVTQPRINDLLRGRVLRFSLDALVNIATALGRRVHVALETA